MTSVAIVGAGLAGLACARALREHNITAEIFEASDAVGGRVRTDRLDGFQLDRGFQVLQTAYPEAQRVLHYESLQLRPFEPGALIHSQGQIRSMIDPWRRPQQVFTSLFNGVGTFADRWRLARLRYQTRNASADAGNAPQDPATEDYLKDELGFSPDMIARFLRPWFAGVFLEPKLTTSRYFFEFTFRMFASGDAALPAAGMQAIPEQLAAQLPPEHLHLRQPVNTIEGTRLKFTDGRTLPFDAIVLATDGSTAQKLTPELLPEVNWRATTCLYFAAEQPPISQPMLLLNGDGSDGGPIHHCCVPNLVAPSYAPPGAALISVSVLGTHADETTRGKVLAQLRQWFGADVNRWRHLRSYVIREALPAATTGQSTNGDPCGLRPGVYCCGDYRLAPSIQGALASGRLAAEAVAREASSR